MERRFGCTAVGVELQLEPRACDLVAIVREVALRFRTLHTHLESLTTPEGGRAVVRMPAEIDVTNAYEVTQRLRPSSRPRWTRAPRTTSLPA